MKYLFGVAAALNAITFTVSFFRKGVEVGTVTTHLLICLGIYFILDKLDNIKTP